jgi:arachidonate 15-lipoxygenase
MFPTLRTPRALSAWREDWSFGWQRVAGPCPVVIKRIDALPACLAVADDDVRRALADERVRLADLLTQGRLYVADYEMFAGLRAGVTDGHQKYLWAPVALFVAHPRGLAPVAIQLGGHEGRADTLVTPAMGPRWMLARAAVQSVDEAHQGVLTHVGWCHMIIQRFIFAMHRQLAATHPISVLLAPHFDNTLAVNQVARDKVLNPGGTQDRLLAPVLDDQLTLMRSSVESIDLASLDPTVDFARRGVDDLRALPSYPFRDDLLPLWEATRAFVASYLALYYTSDADVAADVELKAFVDEVGSTDGGRLPKLLAGVRVATVDDVVQLVSRIVVRASSYHAAINDSSYDWVSVAPNMPSAAFGPVPAAGAPVADDAFAKMLPPVSIAFEVVSATYNVAELGTNRLGQYPAGSFTDPRVAPLVASFQERLRGIEDRTAAHNRERPLPYDFLLPSRVTASINA